MLYDPRADTGGRKRRASWKLLIKVMVLAGSYIGIVSCSALTARLATDSKALANHATCGIYRAPANWTGLEGSRLIDFNTELQSAALAESCFHASEGADGCNSFIQQSIPYSISHPACPFRDAGMCYNGGSHVVRFSTGHVDSRAFGLNLPETLQFWRETTCSLLTIKSTFVYARIWKGSPIYYYSYGYSKSYPDDPYVTLITTSSMAMERRSQAAFRNITRTYHDQYEELR